MVTSGLSGKNRSVDTDFYDPVPPQAVLETHACLDLANAVSPTRLEMTEIELIDPIICAPNRG